MSKVETESPQNWVPLLSLWWTSLTKTIPFPVLLSSPSGIQSIKEKLGVQPSRAFMALQGIEAPSCPCFSFAEKGFHLLGLPWVSKTQTVTRERMKEKRLRKMASAIKQSPSSSSRDTHNNLCISLSCSAGTKTSMQVEGDDCMLTTST